MFSELNIEPSAFAVAQHYKGMISHFIIDLIDHDLERNISSLGMKTTAVNTVMKTREDRRQLAADVLNFVQRAA